MKKILKEYFGKYTFSPLISALFTLGIINSGCSSSEQLAFKIHDDDCKIISSPNSSYYYSDYPFSKDIITTYASQNDTMTSIVKLNRLEALRTINKYHSYFYNEFKIKSNYDEKTASLIIKNISDLTIIHRKYYETVPIYVGTVEESFQSTEYQEITTWTGGINSKPVTRLVKVPKTVSYNKPVYDYKKTGKTLQMWNAEIRIDPTSFKIIHVDTNFYRKGYFFNLIRTKNVPDDIFISKIIKTYKGYGLANPIMKEEKSPFINALHVILQTSGGIASAFITKKIYIGNNNTNFMKYFLPAVGFVGGALISKILLDMLLPYAYGINIKMDILWLKN